MGKTHEFWPVASILLVSCLLRVALIFRGGQNYFPDEIRYENSVAVAGFILQGRLTDALSTLTAGVEHVGFRMIAVIPALFGHWIDETPRIPALFFASFSVLNLSLIWLLARYLSQSPFVGIHALGMAASCQSLLYFSRHLLPYDVSMFFALATMALGLIRSATPHTLLVGGMFASLCFITYNGYWPLAGFGMIFLFWSRTKNISRVVRDVCLVFVGFLLPLYAFAAASAAVGNGILTSYKDFAGSVNQGDFSEGWAIPFEYLWQTERLIFPIVIVLGVYFSLLALRTKSDYVLPSAAGIIFVYLCLLIPSVVLRQFVVYGRLVRQIIPFLILLAAGGMVELRNRGEFGRVIYSALVMTILLQSAWSYRSAWSIEFPREFIYEAGIQFPEIRFSPKRMNTGAPSACRSNDYLIENVKYIFPLPESVPDIEGNLLKSAPHPINYYPYQYEGFSLNERTVFRSHVVTMKIIRVGKDIQVQLGAGWSSIRDCFIMEK
jgi:hypothetical protein